MNIQKRIRAYLLGALLAGIGIQTGNTQNTCQAGFIWSQSQLKSDTVAFSSYGSTGITANTIFYWDFGNGSHGYGQSTSGYYTAPGKYLVCLTIRDSLSNCNSTHCDSVQVYGSVICGLTASATTINSSCPTCTDGTVSVQSVNGGMAPYSYSWSGLPGNVSQETGLGAGTYTVTVTDKNQCQAQTTATVYGNGNNCIANFNATQTASNTIAFTDHSTGILSTTPYLYNFGDGTTDVTRNPVHVYAHSGNYMVCLFIGDTTNPIGCNTSYCNMVQVNYSGNCNLRFTTGAKPVSCINCWNGAVWVGNITGGTAPYQILWNNNGGGDTLYNRFAGTNMVCVTDANGCQHCDTVVVPFVSGPCHSQFSYTTTASNTATFTNQSSFVNTDSTYFGYDFGDNTGSGGLHGSQLNTISHVYPAPGLYTVCLYIIDPTAAGGPCSNTYCDTIRIGTSQGCNFTLKTVSTPGTCYNCPDGSATVSVTGGTGPFTYSWSNTTAQTASVNNLPWGSYVVCVTDVNGCTICVPDTIRLNYNAHSCNASFTIQPDSLHPGNYTLIDYATGTGPLVHQWSWGDNTIDTTATPTHTYATAGSYDICLTIRDSTGCMSTFCDSLAALRIASWAMGNHTTINVVNGTTTYVPEIKTLNNWNIYPNPSSGQTTISYTLGQNSDILINVYDLVGREIIPGQKISNQEVGKHESLIDAGTLQPGTYLVRITANKNVDTKRLSVIR